MDLPTFWILVLGLGLLVGFYYYTANSEEDYKRERVINSVLIEQLDYLLNYSYHMVREYEEDPEEREEVLNCIDTFDDLIIEDKIYFDV